MKKVLGDKKDKGLTLKLKKSAPKATISGNWKESETSNKDTPSTGSASPIVNPQDEKTLAGFANGHPVEDKVDVVQCKHCRRPVLRAASASHVRECLNKKQEKLKKKKEAKEAKDAALRKEKGEDDDTGMNARKAVKGTVGDGEGAKKGKKRKLEDGEGKPGSKKKKKDEPKPKGAKPKGPVDVEKQCGVVLPNGGACARSLTCKSHSMGLKRAVPGRSLPYDMLLAQYQKKNQAKQQRKFSQPPTYLSTANSFPQAPPSMPTPPSPKTSSPPAPLTPTKKKTPSWPLSRATVPPPSLPTPPFPSPQNTNTAV